MSFVAAAVVAATSCSAARPKSGDAPLAASSTSPPRPPERDALALEFRASDFADRDALLGDLVESRFRYFRYVNGPFSSAICRRFAKGAAEAGKMPTVNLHGDAHVEQYAVALDGRGLADFDAATLGPPVIDWVRFATSLWLVADGDAAAGSSAVSAFFRGYRAALADPSVQAPEPRVAARMREKWGTPVAWLDGVETLMVPLPLDEQEHMSEASAEYVAQILRQNPALRSGAVQISFTVTNTGRFTSFDVANSPDPRFTQCIRSRGGSLAPLRGGGQINGQVSVNLTAN